MSSYLEVSFAVIAAATDRRKGPSTKYDHFMRVCTKENEENEKFPTLKISNSNPYTCSMRVIMRIFSRKSFSFSSFLFAQTLIKWSYFVDGPLLVIYG